MRSKKNKIIIGICIAMLFMATGYAILSSRLNIKGMSSLTDTWGIRITNIESDPTGRAYNISAPTYNDTSITFEVGVKEPGDKMTFFITVQNFGSIGAILSDIVTNADGSDVIKHSIDGISSGIRMPAGKSHTFSVTTEFDINATEIPEEPIQELTIDLIYIQDDGQDIPGGDIEISQHVLTTLSGTSEIVLENSAGRALSSYKIYGNSVHNGNPTIQTPTTITSLGEEGSITIEIISSSQSEKKEYTIDLNGHEPLRKVVGSVDYIDSVTNQIVRTTRTRTLAGSEAWQLGSSGTNTVNQRFYYSLSDAKAKSSVICSYLPEIYPGSTMIFNKDEVGCNISNGQYFQVKIPKETLTSAGYEVTVEGFKQYLAANPLTIVYELAEDKYQYEDIKLPKINTVYGNSILGINSNVAPSNVILSYYKMN